MSTIGRDSDRYIDTSPLSDADRLRFDLRQHGSIIVYVARGIELFMLMEPVFMLSDSNYYRNADNKYYFKAEYKYVILF